MEEKKSAFTKIAVKPEVKREIDIIAASQQRYTYEIVDEMLKLYKEQMAASQIPKLKKRSPERHDPELVPA